MDIAIAPLSPGYWTLLQEQKNKTFIDLDQWRNPDWSKVKYGLAVGYPNEHKIRVKVGDEEKVGVYLLKVVASLSSDIEPNSLYITLSEELPEPPDYFFSGMSGGVIYAVEGDLGEEITEEALLPAGIIFSGHPSSGRGDTELDSTEAFLTPNHVCIRGLLLTPQTFQAWLDDAGIS